MEFRLNPPDGYKGSTSLDVAVRVMGRDQDGNWDIQLNIRAPQTEDEEHSSPEQMAAVRVYFPHIPESISREQAHAMICYCEYAGTFSRELLVSLTDKYRAMWILIIATLVSHDKNAADEVLEWARKRYQLGSAIVTPTTPSFFDDLVQTCRIIDQELQTGFI
jgi:hypothetical protein